MDNVKERLSNFLKFKKISQKRFAQAVGVSDSFVANIRVSIQPKTIEKISANFPELNISWLLTGEGSMLKDEDPIEQDNSIAQAEYVPLIPVGAFAGEVQGFSAHGVDLARCEKVMSPISGCDIAIDVSGDSMEPDFPNGCRVFCKRIYEERFIAWGNVFVLDTCNGAFIKKVMPSDDKSCIEACSINPHYPSFDIPKNYIYGMYRVLLMARGYSAS